MSESKPTPSPLECVRPIPPQSRRRENTAEPTVLTDINQVVGAAMEDIVVVGNRAVYGLLGNCGDEDPQTPRDQTRIQTRIEKIKGEARRNRPLGLTIPFDHKQLEGAFKTEHMDKRLREFMEPDILTLYVGALSFVRGAADMDIVGQNGLPRCVLSTPLEDSPEEADLQVYSPKGNEPALQIIQPMCDQNGLAIMSSANKSGDPSITTTAKALEFARQHKLPIFIDLPDDQRPLKPRGSYPIIEVTTTGIRLARLGCFGTDILKALLHDLPVASPIVEQRNHEHILHLDDLRSPNAKRATGPDMRKYLLEHLGIG